LTDLEREEEEYLEACYQGDVKKIKDVISNKTKHPVDPKKCVNDEGKNGIHLATLSGTYRNLEIMRVLAGYGVDLNGTTILEKRTPLMLAAIVGNELAA
jgi:ankyrin repeat protein